VPGSHHSSASAMAAHILSQSHRSSTVVSSGMPGTPAVWFRT
jgi:hypothetical protein